MTTRNVILLLVLSHAAVYTWGQDQQAFFDSLQVKASRNPWTQRLHNVIIREPRSPLTEDTLHTRLSTEPFHVFAGRSIRSIRFTKLLPFGSSIYDTVPVPLRGIKQFGNELHRETRDKVLWNYLLFSEGDRIDPNRMADNERLIRRLPFIQDAVIHIHETSPGSDSVDVVVVVKDAFFLGLGGEIRDFNAGALEIFNPNLFGYGHQLHTAFHWDGNKEPWLGNEVYYKIHNPGGTFLNGRIRYAHIFETETYELGIDRTFFTPETKYAGALNLERTRTQRNITFPDTLEGPVPLKFNLYEGWIGRSFYLGQLRNLTQNRLNFIISTRLYHHHFIKRPEPSENSLYGYQNRTGWLTGMALSSQSFFESNLILDFGRTEDIPQGMLLKFTFGPEYGEFNRRFYAGVSYAQGRYLGNLGYLYTRLEGGGFLKKQSFVEQGVINLKGDYFSNLFVINRFKVRHFISGNYTRGIRRFEDESIDFRGDNGIRGFRSGSVAGTQRLVLNYEMTTFTPYYLYGFRFVIFGFVDAGMIGPDTESFTDGEFYSGLGMGLRIRNERLVFETISIRLGIYPGYPEKDLPLFLDVAGRERLNPENFRVSKPMMIGFD